MNNMDTKEVRKLIAKCKNCRYCSNRNQSWLGQLIDRIFDLDIFVKCYRPSNMVFNIGSMRGYKFYCYTVCKNCKVVKR